MQRVTALTIALLFAAFLIGACSEPSEWSIDLGTEVVDGSIVATGTTNLPDESVIEVRVTNENYADRSAVTSVKQGQFQATLDTTGMLPGPATVTAWFAVQEDQPPAILEVFGPEGENLVGANVLETSDGIRYLEVNDSVSIGG